MGLFQTTHHLLCSLQTLVTQTGLNSVLTQGNDQLQTLLGDKYSSVIHCVKPCSHIPPMYLWRSCWYRLAYFLDEWEHAPPAIRAIAEIYHRHTFEVELKSTSQACRSKDWDDQCCQPVLFTYQNSILGSTGSHVTGALAACENQA